MKNEETLYSVEDRQRWRKLLLSKGGEVAAMLEKLLAKKDVRLQDLQLRMVDDEKEPKEKRLRRYFDLIMKRLREVDDPGFGFDKVQGKFLPVAVLNETPWIDTT